MGHRKLIPVATALLIILVCISPAWSQSQDDGTVIFEQAQELRRKAQSKADLEVSLAKYRDALAIFEMVGAGGGQVSTLNSMGRVHAALGQDSKAIELFEKSLEVSRKIGNPQAEGRTLSSMGGTYASMGQYAKAMKFYEMALALERKIGDIRGESFTLNNMGGVYRAWARYSRAVECHEKALGIKIKLGDVRGEGQTLNKLGGVYLDRGQYSRAMEFFEKALEIGLKQEDVRGQGDALHNMGLAYFRGGQYSKSMESFEKALEIKRQLGNLPDAGVVLANMGNIYKAWGQYQKALESYDKSLEINRAIGNIPGEGQTLNNLCSFYRSTGQYSKAMEFCQRGIEIERQLGEVKAEGIGLINIGRINAQTGEFENALANLQQGLSVFEKIGVPVRWPKKLIGELYLDMGDPDKATPFLEEAGDFASMGRLYLMKSDYARARECYGKLLESAEKNHRADSLFTAYTGLGMCYERMKDPTEALQHYRKARKLTEEMRNSVPRDQAESFFDVKVGGFLRTAPYEGVARVLIKLDRPEEAFKASEYAKARLFAEAISRRPTEAGLDVASDILKKDSELSDQLSALRMESQRAYEKNNREVIQSLEPQIRELEKAFRSHVKSLRGTHPLFANSKYPTPVDLEHTALRKNEWALSYDVTDPCTIIYLSKGKEIVKAMLKETPRKDIDELVRRFRGSMERVTMSANPTEELRSFDLESGKKLADILLGDMLPEIPMATPLIIVPDDSLGVLPFEMLPLADGGKIVTDKRKMIPCVTGAEFFGDRNPISYYQSVTALTLARTFGKAKAAGDKRLVMADPIFGPDDSRLTGIPEKTKMKSMGPALDKLMAAKQELNIAWPRLELTAELGGFIKKLAPQSTDLFLGKEAAKEKLFSSPLQDYQVVVFATHGYAGSDLPGIQEPVLLLTLWDQAAGRDGFLRLTEVMGMKLNADLVALTACESGLGKRISGEGVMGMGRAFQYAGAKSVLMSLWSVEQTASVKLVEEFFRHLKDGKTKLEAINLARNKIRGQGYDHPLFWAPFILVGEID